jgi:phosphatidylglycerol:prolipoprotein diacylglycerol transferase
MHQVLFTIHSSWVLSFLTILQFGVPALCVVLVAHTAIRHQRYDWMTLATGLAVAVGTHFIRPLVEARLAPQMPVYSYGVMLVIGFFGAILLAKVLARHSRIDPEVFATAGLIALVSGVAGSRLSHVLENLHTYTDPHRTFGENLWDAVNIRSGGLTFYGGLLLATPCTILYGIIKKVPIKTGMDIVAPCVMIGLGFGRIGCFLNGCCYGAECDTASVPWAMHFPYESNPYLDQWNKFEITPPPDLTSHRDNYGRAVPMTLSEIQSIPDPRLRQHLVDLTQEKQNMSRAVHPAQLYSTITALLIAAVLVAYYTLPHVPGRVFAMMLLIESPTRYILEMLRSEPAVIGRTSYPEHLAFLPPQSFSMVLSIILFAVAIVLWFAFRGRRQVPGEPAFRAGLTPVPA